MVIKNGTIQKLGYGFLFVFYSNYGCRPILYRFGDKAKYWSKITIFSYPLHSTPPLGGRSYRNINMPFGKEKLEWSDSPMVKKV